MAAMRLDRIGADRARDGGGAAEEEPAPPGSGWYGKRSSKDRIRQTVARLSAIRSFSQQAGSQSHAAAAAAAAAAGAAAGDPTVTRVDSVVSIAGAEPESPAAGAKPAKKFPARPNLAMLSSENL